MNPSDQFPLRDKALRIRVSAHELAAIQKQYGPNVSEGVRLRLLKRPPGRPRRLVHAADPQLVASVGATLAELRAIKNLIGDFAFDPAITPGLALIHAQLSQTSKSLIQILKHHDNRIHQEQ